MQQHAPDPICYSGLATVSQASGVSLRQLQRDVASGALLSFKRGRKRCVFRTDLEKYLRGERGEPPSATAAPATPAV